MKLPLLADPKVRNAQPTSSPAIDPRTRTLASRAWLAIIGVPGDEAPVRFACALAGALQAQRRYALISRNAPAAVEQALRDAGCQTVRLAAVASAELTAETLTAVPAGAIALVVESELAAHTRGLLDIWVGLAPNVQHGAALLALHAAADASVPASALGLASALGAALGDRLGGPSVRINGHTNAAQRA
jgi:hypothetical protein